MGDSAEGGETATDFKLYADIQTELSVNKGCLMWVGQVIRSAKMRPDDELELLHSTHTMGSSAMKNMARR